MSDLIDILSWPEHPLAANDQPDMERLVAILTQQQAGIDMLTSILIKQEARVGSLEMELRRLKARGDAPARSTILRV